MGKKVGPLERGVQDALSKIRLNEVLTGHAIFCSVVGILLLISPHQTVGKLTGVYSHFAHELIRCYGALTLAQGWMTFQSRNIVDYRVRKILCESYAICYLLHFLALIRAQLTGSSGPFGILCTFFSLILSMLYGYFRFMVKPKIFQLPKSMGSEL